MYDIKLAEHFDVSVRTPTSSHQLRDPPQRATHGACFAILLTAQSSISALHSNDTGELATIGILFLSSNANTEIHR
jgi:hypothetical protein